MNRQPMALRSPEERRVGGAAVEYRLIFFERPKLGDRIELRSAIVEVAERYRRTAHWLLDPDTGRAWGAAANVGINFDLQTRKIMSVPPEVLQARILPQIPAGRLGEPDEVAQLVGYLVSERAGFVNGANMAINGGQHMA